MNTERLNLLLICVDQWRGDALGCAGHPVVQTPHLDVLAADGARFAHAYSACPSCIPARAELMTGLCGARNGFVGYNDAVPWHYPVTLAGTLAAAGYHTQCVGKMHVYPWRNLLGYHHVVLHDGYMHRARRDHRELGMVDDYLPWLREQVGAAYADHNDTGIGCNGYAVAPWCHPDRTHPSAWVTSQSIDFLRRRDPTKPFFLTMSYHRPHPPLDPPARYLDRYRDAELPPIPVGDWVDSPPRPNHGLDSPIPTDPAQIDLARRAYFAQITFIDHQLNRMIMALNDHGVMDNTAILFFSDHGELLFDHRLCAKGHAYQGAVHIPMLLHLPGRLAPERGQLVDSPVAIRDIFPTLCELAGIPEPEGLDGRSLLPLWRGEGAGRAWIHGEHFIGPDSNHWLCDGRRKYIWLSQSGKERFFDLEADPQELHDLSATQVETLEVWRSRLIEKLRDRPEGFVSEGRLVPGRPQGPTLEHVGRGV